MYQYKLEGLDDDWTPSTSKTEATYSSLPPGNYMFKVKAMNNDGLWNQEPVTFEFVISPPWYKTWWFYTICVITLIGGFWLYNFTHTKKLIADKQKLEVQVTERTKELREEKEKVEVINKEVIEQKTVIEHHNIEIMDSIKYAKNIQEALLPSLNEINSLFKNSFVLYMPKDIVSGDFYWATKKDTKFFIAVCDSTGHGVPGAFMSLLNISFLNEAINEKNITDPNLIFDYVRQRLIENLSQEEQQDGMDGTLLCIDYSTRTITYAAAYNAPIIIRDKQIIINPADKMPIGKGIKTEPFKNYTLDCKIGDTIYLLTDGFPDQFGGPKGKKFKYKQIRELMCEYAEIPLNEQVFKFNEAFESWRGLLEQVDDVTCMGMKII